MVGVGSRLGGLIAAGAGMVGYSVSEDDQQQLVTLLTAAASALDGIVAVIRRLSTRKRIGGVRQSPPSSVEIPVSDAG
mgnify:CR=1 FL=1